MCRISQQHFSLIGEIFFFLECQPGRKTLFREKPQENNSMERCTTCIRPFYKKCNHELFQN